MTAIALNHETNAHGSKVAKSFFDHALARTTARPPQQAGAGIEAGSVESATVRETDAAHQALADRRIEARIISVLRHADTIRTRARNVYVSVSEGVVRLYGAVRDSGAARDIEQAVRTNTGIDEVLNEIHTIGARSGD